MADRYAAAVAYARERGTADGTNAAGWYVQETIGGRMSGDPVKAARYILRGIDAGDPAVSDGFPFADLSGEWADTLTGPQLAAEAIAAAGFVHSNGSTDPSPWGHAPGACETCDAWDATGEICDAYEDAYSAAVSAEIERAARYMLAED